MKTKIYMVTMTSYTTSDNNLYNNTWTYNNEEEARQQYISLRDEQSEECRWGADYDNDDHTDDCEYNMSEREDGDTYEASSEAYEGYRVQIKLETVEIDVPFATDRRKYGMTLKEIRDEIAAFKDCSFTEATKKAETFRQNCCVPLTWVVSIRLSFGKYSRTENGEVVYYGENRDTLHFEYTDREGDRHQFSIIE